MFYYKCHEEPQNSIGNYAGPYITHRVLQGSRIQCFRSLCEGLDIMVVPNSRVLLRFSKPETLSPKLKISYASGYPAAPDHPKNPSISYPRFTQSPNPYAGTLSLWPVRRPS